MAKFELVMPKMGESITEATILGWTKNIGDQIEEDEPVLDIATDKVDSEVPSPVDGVLLEQRFNEGDVVPVGAVIAVIETEGAEASEGSPVSSNGHSEAETTTVADAPVAKETPAPVLETVAAGTQLKPSEGARFYSPLVLNIARTEGISMQELETVPGTGRDGRVTKKDILSYVKGPRTSTSVAPVVEQKAAAEKAAPVKPATASTGGFSIEEKTFTHSGNYEIVEMDRMRKMIAENMVYSKHISPHVTSFVEADVTGIVKWRNKVKNAFQEKYGEKLTYTPIFMEAICKALREMPGVNISVQGTNIIQKKDINIGMAVALPSGNLIVPVIKHADRMNLLGLTSSVNDLANRARQNKLKLEELEGGTYTLTNVGTFGNVMGTPIIMQPQVAILAAGQSGKSPQL